jgi:hypothetical protein
MPRIGDLRTNIGIFKAEFKPNEKYETATNKSYLGEAWAQINPVRGNKSLDGLPIMNDDAGYSHNIVIRRQDYHIENGMIIGHSGKLSLRWWRIANVKEDSNDFNRFIYIQAQLLERKEYIESQDLTDNIQNYEMPNLSAGYSA